jgi:poly-gamma-glutamate capsule biosynthesis protein CapA/YwtB (metallophosphatase superfamily)
MSEKLEQLRKQLFEAEVLARLEPTPGNIVDASLLRSRVMQQEMKEQR